MAAVAEHTDMQAAMQRPTQKGNRPRGGRKIDQHEKEGKEGKDCGWEEVGKGNGVGWGVREGEEEEEEEREREREREGGWESYF